MEVRRQVKGIVSANKQYATIDEQIERFIGYLGILSTDNALRTSGMRPENFWMPHSARDKYDNIC
jgi:hypothetical protein